MNPSTKANPSTSIADKLARASQRYAHRANHVMTNRVAGQLLLPPTIACSLESAGPPPAPAPVRSAVWLVPWSARFPPSPRGRFSANVRAN